MSANIVEAVYPAVAVFGYHEFEATSLVFEKIAGFRETCLVGDEQPFS